MLHAIVMAGGAGTRFWPESRADRPKQLLPLAGPRTMIQDTVDRLQGLVPPERVLVVTSARLVEQVAAQLPELPAESILGEPCKRDTAPCIGWAALHVSRDDPDATMVVMPSDHVISPTEVFQKSIARAAQIVDGDPSCLVTFGIRPTYPAEGFGYIERGDSFETAPGEADSPAIFRVAQFREKPPASVAREYLAAGRYYWNSGIFVWKARTILQALGERQPELVEHLQAIATAWGKAGFQSALEREFSAIRGISIDYAVMEQARNVLVVEAPFTWDDVGSWQALARLRGADAQGNTISAKHVGLNTQGTIVRGPDQHLIVTLGMRDCLVVHTADATLVANKHDEESIRKAVKLIEEQGWTGFL